jgi:hypothetical protein
MKDWIVFSKTGLKVIKLIVYPRHLKKKYSKSEKAPGVNKFFLSI